MMITSTSGRIFRNIASNWVALGVNLVLSFLLAPFVVNKLGATLYGIWAVAMQFTGYLYLMDFGVRDSLIRYTAKYRASGNALALRRILSVTFIIYFPVFLGTLLVSAGVAYAFPYLADLGEMDVSTARTTVFLVGASISSTFLFNVYGGFLLGLQRFDIANVQGVIVGILRAGMVVLVLEQGYGIIGLAWTQLGATVLGGVLTYLAAKRLAAQAGLNLTPVPISGRKLRVLLRLVSGYSVYVFINNIGQKIIFASDAIVISLFLPIASVTYYAIAGNLIDYLRMLLSATTRVFNPVASEYAANNDKERLRTLLLRSSRLALTIALPVIASYIVLGDIFVGLWMGRDFVAETSTVLIILAITQILSSPHNSVASILYGIGRHRSLAFMRIFEAAINLALSLALVIPLGIAGVALGTAIPHILIIGVILPLYACRLLGISPLMYLRHSLMGPLVSIIPFMIGAWLARSYMVPHSMLAFFSLVGSLTFMYAAIGYFLCLDNQERNMFRDWMRRSRIGRVMK